MKLNQVFARPTFVIAALLSVLLLSACGDKEAEAAKVAAEATAKAEAAAKVEAAAPAPVVNQAGGYEPTAEERVPGITRTKEEQDKINAEALAGTPMPVIPGEAPAVVEPAPAADTEAAAVAK